MNSNAMETAATSLAGDQRWQAVQHVLTSPTFAKAPRMCALLSFLMLRKLSGMEATITEYAIGIEVFRRDARDYDTTLDPVVRVQMGRLRDRLAQYYAAPGMAGTLRIAIPAGSYVPVLTRSLASDEAGAPETAPSSGPPAPALRAAPPHAEPARCTAPGTPRLAPLRALAPAGMGLLFVSGLEDELASQMFERFGQPAAGACRMEVSVRVESRHARASVRLVDGATEQVLWLRQRDRRGELDIGLQEALAADICDEVRDYLIERRVARRVEHSVRYYEMAAAGPAPRGAAPTGDIQELFSFGEEELPS